MNLKAFPFFDSLQEMREATRHTEPIQALVSRFLPFQIAKVRDGQPIDCINVYRNNGTLYRTIMGNQITYDYHQTDLYDFITYYGAALSEPLPCGRYYLEIQGKYSAVFEAINSVDELLTVEWGNNANLYDTSGTPLVLYSKGFRQRVHLKAEVMEPEYPYQETGKENEYKEFTADFKRVSKEQQFVTVKLPVYLTDALGALPLHKSVHIGPYLEVKGIEVSPEWYDFGTSASVTVRFSEANPVIAMGCSDTLEIEQYDVSGYTPRGFVCGVPDTNAAWTDTGNNTCEQVNGVNTGYLMKEQRDMNPDSATFNQLRTVRSNTVSSACPVAVTYQSREQSEYVQKNDCQPNYIGSVVHVRVLAGAFTSTVSQLDADNKALAHLNATKQATANSEGTCTLAPAYQYIGQVSTRQNTPTQACAQVDYPLAVYSVDGTYAHVSGVFTGPYSDATSLPNGYYRRYSDQKTIDILGGQVNGVYACGNPDYEEF